MEKQLGSLEAGKLADLVVLDKNLFEIDRHEIHGLSPSAVLVEGRVVSGALP
jgi:hypothetical protein